MTTQLTEDELWTLANLGWTHLERGRLDDAQKLFAGLTVLSPQMSYAWHALGVIARRRNNLERAVGCFKHAHQLAPRDPEIGISLGEALLMSGEEAEARGALARVINLGEGTPHAARARALMRT